MMQPLHLELREFGWIACDLTDRSVMGQSSDRKVSRSRLAGAALANGAVPH